MNLEDCCEILDSMRIPITESDREEGTISLLWCKLEISKRNICNETDYIYCNG